MVVIFPYSKSVREEEEPDRSKQFISVFCSRRSWDTEISTKHRILVSAEVIQGSDLIGNTLYYQRSES